MRRRTAVIACFLLLGGVARGAWAGPTAEFQSDLAMAEVRFRAAYHCSAPQQPPEADCRPDLRAFGRTWRKLRQYWENDPPPLYAEDANFSRSLADIAAIATTALWQVEHGRRDQAHLTLAEIHASLAELRQRNGGHAYADEEDAFDDKLAEMADSELEASELTPEQLLRLVEQAGVLSYLSERLQKRAPPLLQRDQEFASRVGEIDRQVSGVRAAVRERRSSAIRAALADLRRSFEDFRLLYE